MYKANVLEIKDGAEKSIIIVGHFKSSLAGGRENTMISKAIEGLKDRIAHLELIYVYRTMLSDVKFLSFFKYKGNICSESPYAGS